jgi:hypothetical protein
MDNFKLFSHFANYLFGPDCIMFNQDYVNELMNKTFGNYLLETKRIIRKISKKGIQSNPMYTDKEIYYLTPFDNVEECADLLIFGREIAETTLVAWLNVIICKCLQISIIMRYSNYGDFFISHRDEKIYYFIANKNKIEYECSGMVLLREMICSCWC